MTATTASAIFTAAHAAAKVADTVVAYKVRFSTALRSAWAAAKQTVTTLMETENEKRIRLHRADYDAAVMAVEAGATEITYRNRQFFAASVYRQEAERREAEIQQQLQALGYAPASYDCNVIIFSFEENLAGVWFYPLNTVADTVRHYLASRPRVRMTYVDLLAAEDREDGITR